MRVQAFAGGDAHATRGGCRARADAYFGDLNAGDPGCVFNEKHWDDLVERGIATDPAKGTKTAEDRQREIDELYASATAARAAEPAAV